MALFRKFCKNTRTKAEMEIIMGKKSNNELRKANGYTFNTEDMLNKLREEFMVGGSVKEEPVHKGVVSGFSVVGKLKSNTKS